MTSKQDDYTFESSLLFQQELPGEEQGRKPDWRTLVLPLISKTMVKNCSYLNICSDISLQSYLQHHGVTAILIRAYTVILPKGHPNPICTHICGKLCKNRCRGKKENRASMYKFPQALSQPLIISGSLNLMCFVYS